MSFKRKIVLLACIISVIIITLIIRSNFIKFTLDSIIENNELARTAIISVSIRDADSGTIIYEKNSKLLLHPASTLKAFTCPLIINELGPDYLVKTSLYKNRDNLYLKLSGDPLLTTGELIELFKNVGNAKQLIIDDSAIDDIHWGVGWMWDDKDNPLMPRISVYTVDHNLSLINDEIVPVDDPKTYFMSWINFKGDIKTGKIPVQTELISEVKHTLNEEIENINKNSDNLASEILFKLAGSGTTENALKLFEKFYNGIGVDTSDLHIVDASGVSHNNLIQADWMSLALSKLYNLNEFKDYRDTFTVPDEEGTLQGRLENLSGNLWAKTGTLAGISGITGYLKTKNNKMICFAILIQNYKGDSHSAESLSDIILNKLSQF